ncbi:MAG TPA: peptidase U32 family protein [Ignavibacteriaceae bacterium]|nr:peptidase U32 family protein [Ignavibacteriaceae bacterium]
MRENIIPELMAPAGNWITLRTAIKNGADAVYFGCDKLNMRAKAKNFTLDELKDVVDFCHKNKVKAYLTVNSIILEDDINDLETILTAAKESGVDMIICWDVAVIQRCKILGLPFCISTQASVSNYQAAEFYASLGAQRVVLARECTFEEIKKIRSKTKIEIETFIHGAMCVAISGRCFLSHEIFGRSANQGDCLQPCRREYEIYDKKVDSSLIVGEDYILSAKDLCAIEFIDKLIEAGIDSFKIEGRKRSPEYVAKVTSVYRRAIDMYFKKQLTDEIKKELLEELKLVYNRGFSTGFYFGKPGTYDFASLEGSASKVRKEYIGKVINYYKKAKAAYVQILSGSLKKKDNILILGQTSGMIEMTVEKILIDEVEVDSAEKGDRITFTCDELVRPNDQVYIYKKED